MSFAFNGIREELGDVTIYADRAPTTAHRVALNARLTELKRGMTPATDMQIRKQMAQVMSVLVPRNTTQQDAAALRAGTFMVLGDCPAWAIEAACTAYMRGEAGDGHWAPTPAEIRQAAKRRMARFEDEINKIEKILNARVVDAPRF